MRVGIRKGIFGDAKLALGVEGLVVRRHAKDWSETAPWALIQSAESQVLIGEPNVVLEGSGRKTASKCGFKLAELCQDSCRPGFHLVVGESIKVGFCYVNSYHKSCFSRQQNDHSETAVRMWMCLGAIVGDLAEQGKQESLSTTRKWKCQRWRVGAKCVLLNERLAPREYVHVTNLRGRSSGVRQEMLHTTEVHQGMRACRFLYVGCLRPCHHFLAVQFLLQIAQGAGKAVSCGPATLDLISD